MIVQPNYIKQARLLADLSLSDMAYIVGVDVSNLSKCERGKLHPTLAVLLSYHIISQTPLSKLFKHGIQAIKDEIARRVQKRIQELESEPINRKINARIASLGRVLEVSLRHSDE